MLSILSSLRVSFQKQRYAVCPRSATRSGINNCAYLLLTILVAFSPAQDPTIIKNKKLTVKDFPGKPDEKSPYLASTNPVLSYEYGFLANCPEKGKIKLAVNTGVYVGKSSWMKLNMIRNQDVINELLSHEQGHYDIWEIFAIDLKGSLTSRCFNRMSYKQEVDSIYRSLNKKYDSLQKRYDRETQNMFNKDMQATWKKKIAALGRKRL